jgi:ribosomal protein S18 acetylase RimI-like enzyme
MKPAIALYQSFGFKEIEAYYDNPLEGATYFSLNLTQKKETL